MTTPSDSQPREAAFFTTIRSWGLMRGDDGFLGGVVDGLSQRVGLARGPARIIVVIAAIFLNGIVLLGYGAAWALLPDRRGNIILQNFGRGMPNVGALIGIGLFGLFGLGGLDNGVTYRLNDLPWDINGPWRALAIIFSILIPMSILAGVVWLIVSLVKRSNGGSAPGAAPTYAAMPGQQPSAAPAAASGAPATASAPVADAAPRASASTSAPQAESGADADTPGEGTATPPPAYAAPPSAAGWRAAPPAPPAPPLRPRVPGPGRGFYLATLAWAVLSIAGVQYVKRQGDLAVHPGVAWFVAFMTGLGVLLVLVSLSGRKLGFLGVVGVLGALPTLAIAASADELRDAWANDESIITIDLGQHDDPPPTNEIDATRLFAPSYTDVVINGTCIADSSVPPNPQSTARLSYDDLKVDTTVDVVSEVTYVTIPKGADLSVRGVGDAQAHVVWPDRDLTCDFYDAGGQHLLLANNTGPALELVVYDDQFANTIVITEVTP